MTQQTGTGRRRAPDGLHYCYRGHLKDRVTPQGVRYCRICRRDAARVRTEAGRQARLTARRARIAARVSPKRGDRQWAAGLFEGEGTISLSRCKGKRTSVARVTVVSTDRAIVRFFVDRWPGCVCSHTPDTRNGRARKAYVWAISSCDAIEGFLRDIRPFLRTARVRRKARLMLVDCRARIELRRTEEMRAGMNARMERMQRLNRRGVVVEEEAL